MLKKDLHGSIEWAKRLSEEVRKLCVFPPIHVLNNVIWIYFFSNDTSYTEKGNEFEKGWNSTVDLNVLLSAQIKIQDDFL